VLFCPFGLTQTELEWVVEIIDKRELLGAGETSIPGVDKNNSQNA